MRTVMLSWIKLNPICKIKETTKKYYGQYLYKAVLEIPAGRIINERQNLSIESLLELRQNTNNRLSAWAASSRVPNSYHKLKKKLDQATVQQLSYWHDTITVNKHDIKHRIEEPWMQLYCNDESKLYALIAQDAKSLKEIYRPASITSLQALEQNEIIVKRPTDYQYKIFLKEGYKLTPDLRESIGQYLINLNDEVKLTKSTQYNFSKRKLWFDGSYFYAKDTDVLTFLNLMAPGIVAGIFKLTYIK